MLKVSILTNKKVLFQKNYSVYHVPWTVLFSANRWRLDVLTFLIKGFGYCFVLIDLG